MQDRYLYRGKRVDNGKWIQGYLYGIYERRYILWGMTNDIPNMVEVDPSTICQCTGLKDKNGRVIWENDIVKHYNDEAHPESYCTGTVLWDENYARFYRTSNEYGLSKPRISSDCIYEVVGNTIDNPELLEE